MVLTHTQAVELLEKYGVKVSCHCNGLPMVKACAEVIQGLEQALGASQNVISGPPVSQILTSQEETLRIANLVTKSLRIPAKQLEDGDILYFKTKDNDFGEQVPRRLHQIIKTATGKNVIVVLGSFADRLKHWTLETKLKFLLILFKPLTEAARQKLLKDLTAELETL